MSKKIVIVLTDWTEDERGEVGESKQVKRQTEGVLTSPGYETLSDMESQWRRLEADSEFWGINICKSL